MARSKCRSIRTRPHRTTKAPPQIVWDDNPAAIGTAEYYRRREEEFDETTQTRKIYKDKTEKVRDWIKELWFRYCEYVGKDPMTVLRTIPIKVLDSFFHWVLHTRRESLRSASSLQTYWNVFTLMRRSETGIIDVPLLIKAQMCAIRQRLAADFDLRTEKKPKPIIRVEDEVELLAALWSSSRMSMEHERLRVQLALLIQLAGITGSRPSALMSLQYQDFKLSLLRDPAGSDWPLLIVDVTFRNTKSFLGPKAYNAFDGLTSPEQLFQLKVTPGLNELQLPIKEAYGSTPVFRRLASSVNGVVVSVDVPATDEWLRDKLKMLGEVVGFDLPVGPYCFRRGAGEAFDGSSHVSDSQRNLILQHASSAVFQHSYLSRYITADTQAAFRGLEPQTALMRAASSMSRTIDPRRPTELSEEQQAQVRRHPEIKLLRRTRDCLKTKMRARYGHTTRAKGLDIYVAYHNTRLQLERRKKAIRKAMLAESKQLFRKCQPAADIARQLSSGATANSAAAMHPTSKDSPEDSPVSVHRQQAIAALLTGASLDPASESERRAKAVAAVTALSGRCESFIPKVCRPRQLIEPKRSLQGVEGQIKSPTFAMECLPTQCIFCLGNTRLLLEPRTKSFYSRAALKKHFQNQHLQHHPDGVPIKCPHPLCDLTLNDKMHLQNHAARIHKTLT